MNVPVQVADELVKELSETEKKTSGSSDGVWMCSSLIAVFM
jgi:hypothetical protein